MTKLNLERCLFHGLRAYGYRYTSLAKKKEAEKLKKITATGCIASRKNLKRILSSDEYNTICDVNTNWNEDDYVSITPFHTKQKNFPAHRNGECVSTWDNSYNIYVAHHPAIILNSTLLENLSIRSNPNDNMLGEIQVKDKIPAEYFIGISLPGISNFDRCLNASIARICAKNQERPTNWENWYDEYYQEIHYEMRENTPEQMAKKWYETLFIFEDALKSLSSPLKLYEEGTGKQIIFSDKMEEIEKMKKKVMSLLF